MSYLFTSESVSPGHPDKIADQISDAILDAIIAEDKNARVAVETMVKSGLVMIAGEITTTAWVDIEQIARDTINEIGYTDPGLGFTGDTCAVLTNISKQSPDIAQGVDAEQQGAGDQGLMFGYACNETPSFMPAPIYYAHKLMKRHAELLHAEQYIIRPDAKAQVTMRYNSQGKPIRIGAVVFSTHHEPEERLSLYDFRRFLLERVINEAIPDNLVDEFTQFHINPAGAFTIGGPIADCGLTGRKIIVDTYGGMARHGGGCFSGKDPSKVDRSAAYMARYLAKNIVAAELADKCEVQLAYAIGKAEPVSVYVNTFNTSICSEEYLAEVIMNNFDLTPAGIIRDLDLLRPIYQKTAVFGHFGREDKDFTWERLDKVEMLKLVAGI